VISRPIVVACSIPLAASVRCRVSTINAMGTLSINAIARRPGRGALAAARTVGTARSKLATGGGANGAYGHNVSGSVG